MPRYIDAELLKKKIFPCGMIADGNYAINAKAVKVAIDACPTADVEEVVRCKDCKHYYTEDGCDGWYACDILGGLHEPDALDFCSYGERKEK